MKLVVEVDSKREYLGRLSGFATRGQLFGPVDACATARAKAGRATGNPQRDPLRPGGHVPFGTYRLAGVRDIPPEHHDEYGPKAVVFVPTGGEALHAESYGRLDLLLHGGAPGPDGRLRPTGGDLRVDDATLAQIIRAASGGAGVTLEVVEWPLGLVERLAGKRRKPSRGAGPSRDDDEDWESDEHYWSDRWDSSSGDSSSSAAPPRSSVDPAAAAVAGAAVAVAASAAAPEGGEGGGFDMCRPEDSGTPEDSATVEASTSY
jgi:hypothetical protein